jgi:hypothetical protein
MEKEILRDAADKIKKFDGMGLHYNLVADQIYDKRRSTDPFDISFLPYIIAGLISFDMGRGGMMGDKPYETEGNSFASRLCSKLQVLRPLLKPLINLDLAQINLEEHRNAIIEVYKTLSDKGALHMDPRKSFHVGATKILHFLNPRLFIIIDRNAARAFRATHNMPFRNTTQPGYLGGTIKRCGNS